ncbi:hypothetical protein BC833DRAFT_528822 [Globomyces pollinis-pini]|nr:hypothetical protein BC833DRAFT_528822 [Globomyces pollinis-pini]
MIFYPVILVGVYFLILIIVDLPIDTIKPNNRHVQEGTQVTGEYGFSLLKEISKVPHSYNSFENDLIYEFLVNEITQIQLAYDSWNCTYPNPLTLLDDDVNLVSMTSKGLIFHESNNLILQLKGKNESACLVSGHFDSYLQSVGSTASGVGISSMMTTLFTLTRKSCHQLLDRTIIFDFNNAEEIESMGMKSMIQHPSFANVSSYINIGISKVCNLIDGMGVAGTMGRNALSSATNFDITQQILDVLPYNHAASYLNSFMKLSSYKTAYNLLEGLNRTGINLLYYGKNYLYHTKMDDLDHISSTCIQSISENLLSSILVMLKPQEENTQQSGLIFFDKMGLDSDVSTSHWMIIQLIVQTTIVSVAIFLSMAYVLSTLGYQLFITTYLTPYLNSTCFVFGCFFMVMLFNSVFSLIKVWINPGVVYGLSELSILSNFFLSLAVICTLDSFWPDIKQSALESDGIEYQPSARQKDEVDDRLENSPFIVDHHFRGLQRTPPIFEWLPLSCLTFWTISSVVAVVLAMLDIVYLPIVNYWVFYGGMSVLIYTALDYYIKKLQSTIEQITKLEKYCILYFKRYFWSLQIVISTTIPFLYTMDLFSLSLLTLPTLFTQNISSIGIDAVFSLQVFMMIFNLIPILMLLNSHTYTKHFFWVIFTILWIPQVLLVPYSEERPLKFSYSETWDFNNLNQTQIHIQTLPTSQAPLMAKQLQELKVLSDLEVYNMNDSLITIKSNSVPLDVDINSMTIQIQKDDDRKGLYHGTFTGLRESRICSISYTSQPNISIELLSGSFHSQTTENMVQLIPDVPNIFTKRNFRITESQVALTVDIMTNSTLEIEWRCFLPSRKSQLYTSIEASLPKWLMVGGDDHSMGELSVLKRTVIPSI